MCPTIDFPHVYAYVSEDSGSGRLFRPVIPVRLLYGKQRAIVPSLIDTGADLPAFNSEVAKRLKIDLADIPPERITGLGDTYGRRYTVYLEFGPLLKPVQCEVWFIEKLQLGRAIGLIGRDKALEPLIVAFNEAEHEIYMTLNSPTRP
jgi:hypothetical protein